DLGVERCLLWAGRLQGGQCRLLLGVAGTRALPALPPGLALLQGAVGERPTAPHDRLQRLLLGWRRLQLVGDGLADRLLFHTGPCCLLGETPAPTGTFVALAGPPLASPGGNPGGLSRVRR